MVKIDKTRKNFFRNSNCHKSSYLQSLISNLVLLIAIYFAVAQDQQAQQVPVMQAQQQQQPQQQQQLQQQQLQQQQQVRTLNSHLIPGIE